MKRKHENISNRKAFFFGPIRNRVDRERYFSFRLQTYTCYSNKNAAADINRNLIYLYISKE